MAMRIEARASDPAPGSRGFPWPVLEQGNSSFAEGVYSVSVEHEEAGKSFELTHEISGANLITRWIDEGKVKFACAVASPASAYRYLTVSDSPSQMIRWDPDDIGEPPKFTPMIVAARDFEHVVDSPSDGVSPLWNRKPVQIAKGSRVAVFPTFGLQQHGMRGLLDFRLNENLPPGNFAIEVSESDGFRFKVNLAKDLFNYLHGGRGQDLTRANIMTHIVSAAFSRLREEYRNDDGEERWESFPNLQALAEQLTSENLPHWLDDNFSPAKAATHFHPHKLPETDDR